jgi:NifU-like protein
LLIVKEKQRVGFTVWRLPFTIWKVSFYPKKINERFQNPRFAGKISGANGIGTNATFICGAVLRLQLKIDPKTKEILGAGFQTSGCGFLIASADALAERIVGRKLTDFHGLEKGNLESEIENVLGKFELNRFHCVELPIKALQDAFTDFREFTLEEFTGEKALICTCFSVSEEQIETSVKGNNLQTVEEVGDFCNAGTGCGSCQQLIQEIIDSSQGVFI